jgi:hypothetical protein
MGRLTLNVLLSFAQFEREVIGERIRDKVAASKRKGMWIGGTLPMGYDLRERKLVVNQDEARTVKHIFERYLELGSVRLLRRDLDGCAMVSAVKASKNGSRRGGKPFSRGGLYHLLSNPIYGDPPQAGTPSKFRILVQTLTKTIRFANAKFEPVLRVEGPCMATAIRCRQLKGPDALPASRSMTMMTTMTGWAASPARFQFCDTRIPRSRASQPSEEDSQLRPTRATRA